VRNRPDGYDNRYEDGPDQKDREHRAHERENAVKYRFKKTRKQLREQFCEVDLRGRGVLLAGSIPERVFRISDSPHFGGGEFEIARPSKTRGSVRSTRSSVLCVTQERFPFSLNWNIWLKKRLTLSCKRFGVRERELRRRQGRKTVLKIWHHEFRALVTVHKGSQALSLRAVALEAGRVEAIPAYPS